MEKWLIWFLPSASSGGVKEPISTGEVDRQQGCSPPLLQAPEASGRKALFCAFKGKTGINEADMTSNEKKNVRLTHEHS